MPTASHRSPYPPPPVNLRCQDRANRTCLKMDGKARMKKHVNRQRLPASRSRGALAKCNTNCPQWGRTPTQSGCDEHPKVSLKFCQTTKKTCKPFGFRCEDGTCRTLQEFAPGPSHGARTMTAVQAFCPPLPRMS